MGEQWRVDATESQAQPRPSAKWHRTTLSDSRSWRGIYRLPPGILLYYGGLVGSTPQSWASFALAVVYFSPSSQQAKQETHTRLNAMPQQRGQPGWV
ncbi:hypothetical protein M8818_004204 [Zalaria obscura]|uniref:Uncharacterized protein n=1 Tax=Zalaria obscura TaxID=2024903 RepID=A0ACC3SDJ1_9PEZI